MSGWFEISQASNGQYRFVLKAGNGEIILTSEQYKAKASAKMASLRYKRTVRMMGVMID